MTTDPSNEELKKLQRDLEVQLRTVMCILGFYSCIKDTKAYCEIYFFFLYNIFWFSSVFIKACIPFLLSPVLNLSVPTLFRLVVLRSDVDVTSQFIFFTVLISSAFLSAIPLC